MIPLVESEIAESFSLISDDYIDMRQMLEYHLGWENGIDDLSNQGKRIRPLLLLLTFASINDGWEKSICAASAIELFHNFSLIHDDIEDNSDFRRGRKTLWKKYGKAQAINCGDAMFAMAQLEMIKNHKNFPEGVSLKASKIFNEACIHLTGGQSLDIKFEKSDIITIEEYMTMIGGKTASLISTSTELGALFSGASESTIKFFKKFGYALGMAFQIYDDYLGIWGDQEIIGKSNLSDLMNRKKSLPVLIGLNERGSFYQRWNSLAPITSEEVGTLSAGLENIGAKQKTINAANDWLKEAVHYLHSGINEKNNAFNALVELTNNIVNRNK